ncbi:undecaprenyl-phosphate glucose phosphotransferase [Nitrospinaceae bacterium]|nr:undecaprenyl-phosphate glucose phosphotransferase [Nitrospinaceae bacterium]
MLKKHGQLFLTIAIFFDSIVISFSWLAAFYIHFKTSWGPPPRHAIPGIEIYLLALIPVWIVFMSSIRVCGLYQPQRGKPLSGKIFNITKVTAISVLVLAAITFFYREESFSRFVAVYFFCLVIILMVVSHLLIHIVLKKIRSLGFNVRHVLIAGTGDLAQSVAEKIFLHSEYGFNIIGFLTAHPEEINSELRGIRVIGALNEISAAIHKYGIDKLFIALPLNAHNEMEAVLDSLGEETVDIYVVPDLLKFMNLQSGVEDLDGLPIVNLSESPLQGWNIVVKRFSDIIFSFIFIIVSSPFLILLAIIIKFESEGSIIYRQERVGFDGNIFKMFKFRTMQVGAEDETGPIWASKEDNRRTRLGAFLRKTSIDELPQLFNVLMGDMSLVGPRPERKVFVEEFKKSIPKYMLRLKMKAGLTGWAQVNGWRGNTSLDKRIEFDLYYIKHWSLLLDLKIIFMTFWKGFVNPHAY